MANDTADGWSREQSRFPFRRSQHGPPADALPSSHPAARIRHEVPFTYTNDPVASASDDSSGTAATASTDFNKEKAPYTERLHHTGNARDGTAVSADGHDAYQVPYDDQLQDDYDNMVRADTQDSLAVVRTISRVPGNETYYEKNGLRTYGDGQDHLTEPPMTFKRFGIFIAMGFLWTASQIPLYLFGGVIPIIQADLGGGARYVWILLAYLIPLASITPFVGPIADLVGRRNVALAGVAFIIIGSIVCATAQTMNIFIGGQSFNGIGAGILELVALAVAGESAPTAKRGLYVGGIIITIVPYCPSVLYAQLVSHSSSWRYIGLWTGLWAFTGGVLTAIFYWPPRRANRGGLSKREILARIDYTGGVLSSAGLTLFIMGLSWGGNQYAWNSTHVMPCLIIGSIFIVAFFVWEFTFVKYPMFPRRLGANPRALTAVLVMTFASGANFFAVLVFWPTQYQFVYTSDSPYPQDPVQVGIGSLPVGFGIIGGSIIFSLLLTIFKGHIKWLLVGSTIVMTAGTGAMAVARLDNLNQVFVALTFACVGVGAVIVPNQIIAGVICPDDLIGSITALTISVRFVGGAISYAAYYHVIRQNFLQHLNPIAGAIIASGIIDPAIAIDIVYALSYDERGVLLQYPILANNITAAEAIIHAGQEAFALSYPTCYYVSIAFGTVSIIAALFLPNIANLMDHHIAVQYIDAPKREKERNMASNHV